MLCLIQHIYPLVANMFYCNLVCFVSHKLENKEQLVFPLPLKTNKKQLFNLKRSPALIENSNWVLSVEGCDLCVRFACMYSSHERCGEANKGNINNRLMKNIKFMAGGEVHGM